MEANLIATLKILLSLAGTIIILMLGVLGYFIKRIINSLDNFNETLQHFSVDYSATKQKIKNFEEKYGKLEDRVTRHGDRLDCHEKDIEVLKEKVKKK